MIRALMTVVAAAAIGSLAASSITFLLALDNGAFPAPRMVIGLSVISMFFTVPGALMLFGAQAHLMARSIPVTQVRLYVVLLGVFAGGLALGVFDGVKGAEVGAVFGLPTSIALLGLSKQKAATK